MASGSSKTVRWPWLIVAVAGLVGCVVLLITSFSGRSKRDEAPMASAPTAVGSGAAAPPAPVNAPTLKPPPEPEAPAPDSSELAHADPPKPTPTKTVAKKKLASPRLGKPMAPAPPTAAGPYGPSVGSDGAPAGEGAEKTERQAVSGGKKKEKKLAASNDDADDVVAAPKLEDAAPRPRMAKSAPGRVDAPVKGKGGVGSRERKKLASRNTKQAERGDDDGDDSSDGGKKEAQAEQAEFAKLLPGRFAVKVPEKMLINQSVHVRATVAEKKDAPRAQAVLEAAPVGPGPAKIVTEEVMVGKLLRVELRGPLREFEIMPITPAEQRVHNGSIAQWEWVVVPREEGQHELSVVVTNLLDWSGHPLELSVHSALVSVEVTTMQRVRGYASIVSSIFSGITGLVGAWMALLRPFLRRRREEEEEKDAKKDKESKDAKAESPAPPKAEEKPPAEAASPSPPPVTPAA